MTKWKTRFHTETTENLLAALVYIITKFSQMHFYWEAIALAADLAY